jgi:hypothetical protein
MSAGSHYAVGRKPFLLGKSGPWLRWSLLTAQLRAGLAALAPVGYEDETGFQFGVKTASFLTGARRSALACAGLLVRASQFSRHPQSPRPARGMMTDAPVQDFCPADNRPPSALIWIGREFLAN